MALRQPPQLLSCVDSTNLYLSRQWDNNPHLPNFTSVVARHQSAGRGRQQRHWFAPAGTALLQTTLLRLPTNTNLGWVPLLTGLAVLDLVVGSLLPPPTPITLKWPNDVLFGARKGAGILGQVLQVASGPGTEHVLLIGVGLNLSQSRTQLCGLEAASLATAGSVLVPGVPLQDRELQRWGAALNEHLNHRLQQSETEPQQLQADYRHASATLGSDVTATLADGTTVCGRAVNVDADGHLQIETHDGQTLTVTAGDVSLGAPFLSDNTEIPFSTCEECQ